MLLVLRPEHTDLMLVDQEASTQVHTVPRCGRVLDVVAVGPLCQLAKDVGQQRLVRGLAHYAALEYRRAIRDANAAIRLEPTLTWAYLVRSNSS
jgi:hypothetical protein